MAVSEKEELLSDPEVKLEIERYKWLESEKRGADIGMETATEEWLKDFAKSWLKLRVVLKKTNGRSAKRV